MFLQLQLGLQKKKVKKVSSWILKTTVEPLKPQWTLKNNFLPYLQQTWAQKSSCKPSQHPVCFVAVGLIQAMYKLLYLSGFSLLLAITSSIKRSESSPLQITRQMWWDALDHAQSLDFLLTFLTSLIFLLTASRTLSWSSARFLFTLSKLRLGLFFFSFFFCA